MFKQRKNKREVPDFPDKYCWDCGQKLEIVVRYSPQYYYTKTGEPYYYRSIFSCCPDDVERLLQRFYNKYGMTDDVKAEYLVRHEQLNGIIEKSKHIIHSYDELADSAEDLY